MNKELPEFDTEAVCPKCGSDDVAMRCVEDGTIMLRTCRDCEWSWKELPLDLSFVESDDDDDDDEDCCEKAGEGDAMNHCGNHEAPKVDPLQKVRDLSQPLYAGNGFELRVVTNPTPELLEAVGLAGSAIKKFEINVG